MPDKIRDYATGRMLPLTPWAYHQWLSFSSNGKSLLRSRSCSAPLRPGQQFQRLPLGPHADVRVVAQHSLGDVTGDVLDHLLANLRLFSQFGDRVVPEVVGTQTRHPCRLAERAPGRTPAACAHGLGGIVSLPRLTGEQVVVWVACPLRLGPLQQLGCRPVRIIVQWNQADAVLIFRALPDGDLAALQVHIAQTEVFDLAGASGGVCGQLRRQIGDPPARIAGSNLEQPPL